jgi:hypothetical protein
MVFIFTLNVRRFIFSFCSAMDVEQGLAQLVLTILELLRQLVERQAIRRVEGGMLTEEQIYSRMSSYSNSYNKSD